MTYCLSRSLPDSLRMGSRFARLSRPYYLPALPALPTYIDIIIKTGGGYRGDTEGEFRLS